MRFHSCALILTVAGNFAGCAGDACKDAECDGTENDDDDGEDTDSESTEDSATDGTTDDSDTDTDVEPPPGPPFLTAEVTSDSVPTYTFHGDFIFGGVYQGIVFTVAGADFTTDAVLLFAVLGSGEGTYDVAPVPPGALVQFTDPTTFTKPESVFTGMSGTLTVTSWTTVGEGEEKTDMSSGTFDVELSNEAPENPNPPITLQMTGEWGNVLMPPLVL